MTADNAPWVYDFRYNYYGNFYRNRLQAMSSSGSYYDMWQNGWIHCDDLRTIDDGYGSVVINDGIDIKAFIKKNYNGDVPECLTDKIENAIKDAIDWGQDVASSIASTINEYLDDLFNSFICTATTDTLSTACGRALLGKMKNYRDNNMTDADGIAMLRYYSVIGPRVVTAIDNDPDRDALYKYLYAEYISKISNLIDDDAQVEILVVYFGMLEEMVIRYDIKTIHRFKQWQMNLR